MRFVLVYTPVKIEGIYKDVIKGVALPPQGICQLAGVIRDYGEEVYLIDALAEDLSEEDAINRIISLNPDFVGFSATTMQILYACQCARLIKEHDQSINVWIGGAHISACPEETMERFKEFDLGVLNEGEVTVKELLRYYKDGAPSLDNINGIIYRSNGKLVKTRPRAFMNDLDSLPLPAWDLLPDLRYNYRQSVARIDRLPAASLTTSRGCPCKCIFCARNVYGRSYRGHSAEYVLKMIDFLVERYGVRSVSFEDENFTVNKQRIVEICKALMRKKYDLKWGCVARVDMIQEENLKLMKKAGCTSISFGIESGSQRILDILGKNLKLETINKGIAMTEKIGIRARGYFIVGHPTETIETIEETKDFIKKLPFSEVQVSFMTPFPGTELYGTANKYGTFNNEWTKLNIWTPNFIPHGLTKDILMVKQKQIMREFFFQPTIIMRFLLRMVNLRYFSKYFRDGMIIFWFLLKNRGKENEV
jgi:radical SAM superfamily enzyme YgiQ (UPF0313 family)